MNYEAVEDSLVLQLAAIAGVADAVPLPDTEDDLVKPFQKARVTVAYKGSKFGDSMRGDRLRSTAETVQYETLRFEVIVQARRRRGSGGVYAVYDSVRKLLVGFKPEGCDRLYHTDFEYADFKEGIWSYTACMECTRLSVEDYAPEDGPLITQINLLESFEVDL